VGREGGERGVDIHMATPGDLIGGDAQATRQGRPGHVIQGGCLKLTSLGAVQSAARPSSGAAPGTAARKVTTVSSLPVNPTPPSAGGKRKGGGKKKKKKKDMTAGGGQEGEDYENEGKYIYVLTNKNK